MIKIKNLIVSLTFIALTACSSQSTFQVTSDPEGAKVFAKKIGSADSIELGKTPLYLQGDDLKKHNFQGGHILIEVRKEGFNPASILITDVVSVDVQTSLSLKPIDQLMFSQTYDRISNKLFEVHRLVRAERYDQALEIIADLKTTYPEMSVPNELEGSIFYLQNDFEKAFDSFSEAYSKNSENTFSLRMKRAIKEQINN